MTPNSPSQPRLLTGSSPVSGARACKPASHYQPSMIVHLPSSESLTSRLFSTPPHRHQQPPSRPVNTVSATLGPSTDPWPTLSSYRPVDSDIIAYRAALDYAEASTSSENVSAAAASEQVVNVRDETEARHKETSVECMLEAPSDDVVATQNAACSEGLITQTDITGDIQVDAGKSSTKLSCEAAETASVEVADEAPDDVVEGSSPVHTSDFIHCEEPRPVVRSEWEETLSEEDLPAVHAPADVIDVLPLGELPCAVDDVVPEDRGLDAGEMAVDEVVPVNTEQRGLDAGEMAVDEVVPVDTEDRGLDAGEMAVDEVVPVNTEHRSLDAGEMDVEWPPLPSEDELQISSAELDLSDDDHLDFVESEVSGPVTALDTSAATESGVLTKVGASEKVLAPATHLTDVDSMHRFK